MSQEFVTYESKGSVAVITLNRPSVLNSIHRAMALELQAHLAAAMTPEIRSVVLTGSGRAFCAGQDLTEAAPDDGSLADIGELVNEHYNPTVKLIRRLEKPVICAVNGVAAGAGANIALSCDFVVASDRASFLQAFSKIGLIPDSGGTWLLPRLVGMAKATALTMLGERVSAQEALEMGMIYRVVRHDDLETEVTQFAERLAKLPTAALGLTKRALSASLSNEWEEQLSLEARLQRVAGHTLDYQEGVRAFLGKREPQFKGK